LFLSDADSSGEEDNMAVVVAPPRVNRQLPKGQGNFIILGDSTENKFTTLFFPQVSVTKDGKRMLVGLVQLHHLLPLASDWSLHRMVLDRDGGGLTWHYPEVPSLHTRGISDVQALASSIHAGLARRGRDVVSVDELHTNLQANFNHLRSEQATNPEAIMSTAHFTFLSASGDKVRCSLDHFNVNTSNNELETHVTTHATTIVTRPDGSVVRQQIYMLTWNLCVCKTARVVLETSVGEVDRLFEAISLVGGTSTHNANG
jgi:hypothetical protein